MDDLTRYVIVYYGSLMTEQETRAYRSMLGFGKIEASSTSAMKGLLQNVFVSDDPDVLALLKDGDEVFLRRVRERILREQADAVFLNTCPQCGALARTPRARQCPACFHSWHGEANSHPK